MNPSSELGRIVQGILAPFQVFQSGTEYIAFVSNDKRFKIDVQVNEPGPVIVFDAHKTQYNVRGDITMFKHVDSLEIDVADPKSDLHSLLTRFIEGLGLGKTGSKFPRCRLA